MKNIFFERLKRIEQQISAERGPFELFALFRRDNGLNMWDIFVSAKWLDLERDKLAALKMITRPLNKEFPEGEIIQFSGIVVIKRDNPGLREIHSAVQVEHGAKEFDNVSFFGMPLLKAVIITSRQIEDSALKQTLMST